tara:strand:- start:480 stop:617 length:138 start_codon:yes stop_codon:yes gene_type:complete
MRKILITLLAAVTLPTAINAEIWYLLINGIKGPFVSVPTSLLAEC